MSDGIHRQVRKQFGNTAHNYVTSSLHRTGHDLDTMLAIAGDVADLRVLDIAAGGGHTAVSFALRGAKVTATDLTPEILEAAKGNADDQGATMAYVECSAESLPFDACSFDIVTCRIAPHHFADPEAFVRESARVLVPGGVFLMVDNVAPEDPALAKTMNYIEKMRDPSHVEAYTVRYWIDLFASSGLETFGLSRWSKRKGYAEWAAIAQMDTDLKAELESYVLALDDASQSYFNVQKKQGALVSLCHEAALFYVRKPD